MASKYYLVDMTTITIMVSEQSLCVDLHKIACTYTESQMREGLMGHYLSLLNYWLILVSQRGSSHYTHKYRHTGSTK